MKSKEEAIEWAKRFWRAHSDVLGPSYEGEGEVRQIAEQPLTSFATCPPWFLGRDEGGDYGGWFSFDPAHSGVGTVGDVGAVGVICSVSCPADPGLDSPPHLSC